MSTDKVKVPDNHMNPPTNATSVKEKLHHKRATHPGHDSKASQPKEKRVKISPNQFRLGKRALQARGIENQDKPLPRPSRKERLGEGYAESPRAAKMGDRPESVLSSVKERDESEEASNAAVNGDIDNNLPSTVTLLTSPGGSKVYVVGTVHYSVQSQEDVAKLIRAVQPDFVILELCRTRSVMLQWDEDAFFKYSQNITFGEALRRSFQLGFLEGLFFLTLFSLSIRMTRELGVAPGGEFRKAYKEAQRVPNCTVIFGDLPIALTLKRLFSSLSFWQVLKILTYFLFRNKKMSQEEVEKYRKMDEVEKMLLQFSKESPDIARVLVNERDAVLTYYLQLAAEKGEPNTVVGVVGLGHMIGIKENWGKISKDQMREIMKVPPPRKHFKFIRYSLKFTAIGLVLYGVHKLASKSALYRALFCSLFPALC